MSKNKGKKKSDEAVKSQLSAKAQANAKAAKAGKQAGKSGKGGKSGKQTKGAAPQSQQAMLQGAIEAAQASAAALREAAEMFAKTGGAENQAAAAEAADEAAKLAAKAADAAPSAVVEGIDGEEDRAVVAPHVSSQQFAPAVAMPSAPIVLPHPSTYAQGAPRPMGVPGVQNPYEDAQFVYDASQMPGQVANVSEYGAAYSPAAAAQAAHPSLGRSSASSRRSRNRSMNKSTGFQPKEPAVTGGLVGRLSQSFSGASQDTGMGAGVGAAYGAPIPGGPGFVDDEFLAALPKFGDPSGPLPEPQEILDSLPSLSAYGFGAQGLQQAQQQTAQRQATASSASLNSNVQSAVAANPESQPASTSEQFSIPIVYGDEEDIAIELPTDDNAQAAVSANAVSPEQVNSAGNVADNVQPEFEQSAYEFTYDPNTGFYYDQNGYPYGYDEYGNLAPYVMPDVPAGKATVSLIFGILSILLGFLPPVGIIFAIVAILSAKSYIRSGGMLPRAGTGRVCGLVGLVLSIIMLVAICVFLAYFMGGMYGSNNAGAIMGWLMTTPVGQFL